MTPRKQKDHTQYPLLCLESRNESETDADWVDTGHLFYKHKSVGFRTHEPYRWSLHKSDFFYLRTLKGVVALVGRTILYEMGVEPDDIPPVTNKEDLLEAKGFPPQPIAIEDLHYHVGHHSVSCYWPKMLSDPIMKVPKLDRTLPKHLAIDILMIHDPDNVLRFRRDETSSSSSSLGSSASDTSDPHYVLQYNAVDATRINIPWVPLPPTQPRITAHLYLSKLKKLGVGHSAHVWKAELELPHEVVQPIFERCCGHRKDEMAEEDLSRDKLKHASLGEDGVLVEVYKGPKRWSITPTPLPTRFTVAAKVSSRTDEALAFSHNEAKCYATFPEHISQDWSGYQVVAPINMPQPACAVVPKSYGYFSPDVTYGNFSNGQKAPLESRILRPVLLLEECGVEVSRAMLSRSFRELCFSLIVRLHMAGFAQQSVYRRNFVVQPGPLHEPPERRTMGRPSFRIIDFGRGLRENVPDNEERKKFYDACFNEKQDAEKMLQFQHWQVDSYVEEEEEEEDTTVDGAHTEEGVGAAVADMVTEPAPLD